MDNFNSFTSEDWQEWLGVTSEDLSAWDSDIASFNTFEGNSIEF